MLARSLYVGMTRTIRIAAGLLPGNGLSPAGTRQRFLDVLSRARPKELAHDISIARGRSRWRPSRPRCKGPHRGVRAGSVAPESSRRPTERAPTTTASTRPSSMAAVLDLQALQRIVVSVQESRSRSIGPSNYQQTACPVRARLSLRIENHNQTDRSNSTSVNTAVATAARLMASTCCCHCPRSPFSCPTE